MEIDDSRFVFIFLIFSLIMGCAKKEAKNIESGEIMESTEERISPSEKKLLSLPNVPLVGAKLNPFLTKEEEQLYSEAGNRIPLDYLSLSAILYSPPFSKAIINGRILKVGNYIDNKEIMNILPEAVILKGADVEYIAKLKKVNEK